MIDARYKKLTGMHAGHIYKVKAPASEMDSPMRWSLQNEAKALDAQKASLDQGSFDQKNASLQVRANALQRKAQIRERELQATQQKALGRVGQELEPVIRASYQQARCSLLIQRDAVVLANPAMDITPSVITGLNAKITQFSFDRERLDQAATAAPAQPARKP